MAQRKFPDLQFFVLVLVLAISRTTHAIAMDHCMFAIYRTLYMSCIPVTARMARLFSTPSAKTRIENQLLLFPLSPKQSSPGLSFRSISTPPLREIESKKPNPEAVKSLMVRTFAERKKNILSGGQMVAALCTEYPFLKKAMYVSGLCIGPVASLQCHLLYRCLGKWTVLCRRRTLLRISFYRGQSTRLP